MYETLKKLVVEKNVLYIYHIELVIAGFQKKTSTVSLESQGASPKCQVYPPPQEDSGLIKGDDFFGTMMVDKRFK